MKSGDRAPDPVPVYVAFGKNAGDLLRFIFEKTGGLSRFVSPGDSVLIKPNVLNDRESATGATTDPLLVNALLSCLRDSGVRKITLAESAWVGADTPACFAKCGYTSRAVPRTGTRSGTLSA